MSKFQLKNTNVIHRLIHLIYLFLLLCLLLAFMLTIIIITGISNEKTLSMPYHTLIHKSSRCKLRSKSSRGACFTSTANVGIEVIIIICEISNIAFSKLRSLLNSSLDSRPCHTFSSCIKESVSYSDLCACISKKGFYYIIIIFFFFTQSLYWYI